MSAPTPEPHPVHPVVAAMAATTCPDCPSETALLRDETGVLVLTIAHEPTCPWLAAHDHPRT